MGDTHKSGGQRPAWVVAPAHLSPNPPIPQNVPAREIAADMKPALDTVRYGDWEKKGIAIDF
jgi:Protein of unknown function (DUF1674)